MGLLACLAMRIVSLLPSATEILFAVGAGADVVGVTFECDYPLEARQRQIVSNTTLPEGLTPAQIDVAVRARLAAGEDLYTLDEGALRDLDPELVVTQDLCAVCAVDLDRVDDALAYLGCTAEVVTLDPHTLDEVLTSILTVGTVLGARTTADELVGALRARLRRLEVTLRGAARPSVLVLEWTDPPFAAGHWIPDLVSAGGGCSVLATPGADSRRVDVDRVSRADADVVIVAPCGYHLDAAATLAVDLVESGILPADADVWAVDADSYFVRPGPRLVDGADLVGAILHPALIGAPDPERARAIRVA
jgi:iron complex transport system substrate-binding protein